MSESVVWTGEVPWKPLRTKDSLVSVYKFETDGTSYRLMVSDLRSIWSQTLDGKQITQINNRLNPNIEASVQRLLSEIGRLLVADTRWRARHRSGDANNMILSAGSKLDNVDFKWSFELSVVDKTEFYEQMTGPLLLMVNELLRRQQSMVAIITDKDTQIADYQAEGVALTRKPKFEHAFSYEKFVQDMEKDASKSIPKPLTFASDPQVQELFVQVVKASRQLPTVNPAHRDQLNESNVPVEVSKIKSPEKRPTSSGSRETTEEEKEKLRRQLLLDKLQEEKIKKDSMKSNKKLKL